MYCLQFGKVRYGSGFMEGYRKTQMADTCMHRVQVPQDSVARTESGQDANRNRGNYSTCVSHALFSAHRYYTHRMAMIDGAEN